MLSKHISNTLSSFHLIVTFNTLYFHFYRTRSKKIRAGLWTSILEQHCINFPWCPTAGVFVSFHSSSDEENQSVGFVATIQGRCSYAGDFKRNDGTLLHTSNIYSAFVWKIGQKMHNPKARRICWVYEIHMGPKWLHISRDVVCVWVLYKNQQCSRR